MKTSIEIPDPLLDQARKEAAREGTTVKALITEGLRKLLAERGSGKAFKLRKATFKGKGLQPDVAEGAWDKIRDLIYEDRGA